MKTIATDIAGRTIPQIMGDADSNFTELLNRSVNPSALKKIAAVDSTSEKRSVADYVCDGVSDYWEFYQATEALGNGAIHVHKGTYQLGSEIVISSGNYVIQGEGVGVTILKRDVAGTNIINNSGTGKVVVRDLTIDSTKGIPNCILINCIYAGKHYSVYPAPSQRDATFYVAAADAPASQKENADYMEGIGGIVSGIGAIRSAIAALPAGGGKIMLSQGTFTSTAAVDLTGKSNVIIEGMGYSTYIQRTGSTNTVFGSNCSNITFRNLRLQSVQNSTRTFGVKFENCWVDQYGNGEKLLNEGNLRKLNVIHVGAGMEFETLTSAWNWIDSSRWAADKFWEIHIYGHTVESASMNFNKANIDLIGHNNCIVEVQSTAYGFFGFTFRAPGTGYGTEVNMKCRDITFLRTGAFDGYNAPCATVDVEGYKFYNCNFENETVAVDTTLTVENDDRRHGLYIYGSSEFYNCVGKASQLAGNNNRGIYVHSGSPLLVNCQGIGGGRGYHGHGIMNHRRSSATLMNCIGRAGGTRRSFGFAFQNATLSKLIGCVGYGVDTGNETVDFDGKAVESGGFLVDYFSKPTLLNCIGYQGNGINSFGIKVENITRDYLPQGGYTDGEPLIQGGYFGVEMKTVTTNFVKDSGQSYMTLSIADIPVSFHDLSFYTNWASGASYIIITLADGVTEILNTKTAVNNLPYNLTAGQQIRVSFYDAADALLSPTDGSFSLIFNYESNQAGCYAMYWDKKSGSVNDVKLRSNAESDCIFISTESQDNGFVMNRLDAECRDTTKNVVVCESAHADLPIINSKLNGALSNVTSFKSLTALLTSSNYK